DTPPEAQEVVVVPSPVVEEPEPQEDAQSPQTRRRRRRGRGGRPAQPVGDLSVDTFIADAIQLNQEAAPPAPEQPVRRRARLVRREPVEPSGQSEPPARPDLDTPVPPPESEVRPVRARRRRPAQSALNVSSEDNTAPSADSAKEPSPTEEKVTPRRTPRRRKSADLEER
ncbi:MAG: hypothetical protein WCL39_03890, partial [Armatimonadota bacterium]